jgi:hypothetical protein
MLISIRALKSDVKKYGSQMFACNQLYIYVLMQCMMQIPRLHTMHQQSRIPDEHTSLGTVFIKTIICLGKVTDEIQNLFTQIISKPCG